MRRKVLILLLCIAMFPAFTVFAQDYCNGNFDYDQDVDGTDAGLFKQHFGRSGFKNPCPPDGPAPVSKTGQYISNYGEDDGFWKKGIESPYPRFEPDPVLPFVRDKLTGLLWFKIPEENYTWQQAIDFCAGAYIQGFYRLANIKEMMSLLHYGWENPALCGVNGSSHHTQGDPFYLPNNQYYWTSTTYKLDDTRAWYYNIDNGGLGHQDKSIQMNAWCVTDGRPIYPRFTINNFDGTVTDNKTGLVWLQDANCFYTKRDWNQAITDCNGLANGQCGLTDGSQAGDWRLPTKEEWEEFICGQFTFPPVCNTRGTGQWFDGDPFYDVNMQTEYYWSSTENDSNTSWAVEMLHGQLIYYPKTTVHYVWPVRNP